MASLTSRRAGFSTPDASKSGQADILVGNPILYADFPDPDVIRVGSTYYMVTTSMHMFPGGQILHSRDLMQWEHAAYVYDVLDEMPAQRLDGGNIYGKGMWAGSLRHHAGVFHLLFVCLDTRNAYHFSATQVEGAWTRHDLQGFFYDPSLLFDDDGRIYIAHGNREIRITEMEPNLSGIKPGGLDRVAICDSDDIMLGYEGTHFYKINGRYYLFCIHWPRGGLRTEACYVADTLDGAFRGGDILCEDMGVTGMGVAQGGVVDTPSGEWYMLLFQDHGAVGRMPVLVPMAWDAEYPIAGAIPHAFTSSALSSGPPLYASDSLRCLPLFAGWQWNHEPHDDLWQVSQIGLSLQTDRVIAGLEQSVNTLTQRCFGPACTAEVTVEAAHMRLGDYAGLCALQGCFAQIGITRTAEGFMLSLITRTAAQKGAPLPAPQERAVVRLDTSTVRLRAEFNFASMADTVRFYFLGLDNRWVPLGDTHQLVYQLDHFMGCRVGLYCYATAQAGGRATFSDFEYKLIGGVP